ncbi:MAG: hypothetical protein HC910_09380 [Spirulinaceae cyanobacterium SM2_1_0]|nr:hypothetical protein [Spirulinaceae cyanobacterium SM2_1_0]
MLPARPHWFRHWRRALPFLLLVAALSLTLTVSTVSASDDGALPVPANNPPAAQNRDAGSQAGTSAPASTADLNNPNQADAADAETAATPDPQTAPPTNRFANSVSGLRAADFAAADDELPVLDWLKLDEEVLADWNVQTVPDNPATLIVTPKWQAMSSHGRSILVLIPIKSEVYSIAISTNLSLFREKNIAATFTIVNYGSIEDYGLALLEQAKRDRIDLILATGSIATDLATEHFRNETVPVVGNTKDPVILNQVAAYDQGSGTNIAYTTFSVPFKTLQTYLLQLKPDLENIAILYAEENQSAVETQVEPMVTLARELGIKARRYGVQNRVNARSELANLIPRAVAEMRQDDPDLKNSIFFLTGSVSVYREIATINRFADKIPVIATLPDVVTEGDDSATISIGGHFRNTSYITSLYAIRVLRGEIAPGDLPIGLVTPPDVAINFRRVRAVDAQVPFTFFEAASFVYDYDGESVRTYGQNVMESAA